MLSAGERIGRVEKVLAIREVQDDRASDDQRPCRGWRRGGGQGAVI
jgi:hypothetical protein